MMPKRQAWYQWAWILLYQAVQCIHLSWRWKGTSHPKTVWSEKMLCSVEHLMAGEKWHALSVPKTTEDELLTSTLAKTEELETFVSSSDKTILFCCDASLKVAAKAQPSVMAYIIPDLGWHHQSSIWTANFSPCFHQFDTFFLNISICHKSDGMPFLAVFSSSTVTISFMYTKILRSHTDHSTSWHSEELAMNSDYHGKLHLNQISNKVYVLFSIRPQPA